MGRPIKKYEAELVGKDRVRLFRKEYAVEVSMEQFLRWQGGEFIQDVMPELDSDQREFLITGFTPDEWTAMFGKEEES